MDQNQTVEADGSDRAEAKAEWVKPTVDRLIAGGAESGGATSTDGIDILS